MNDGDIPNSVLAAMRQAAEDGCGDDEDLNKDAVATEVKAYRALQALDFGVAVGVKKEILKEVNDLTDGWEERLSLAEDEMAAFKELLEFSEDDLPEKLLADLKKTAAKEHVGDYSSQRDYVVNGVAHHRYVEEISAHASPAPA